MFGIVHAHTMYSLDDSAQTPEELVERAKELGIQNVALTDHGTLLGIDDFLAAGKKHGINAVPGLEAYLENRQHFILIAKDLEGYRSISKALRDAQERLVKIRNRTYPIMDDTILRKHFIGNRHVIATSACISGPIAAVLLQGRRLQREKQKLEDKMETLKEFFLSWQNTESVYQKLRMEEQKIKKERTGLKQRCKQLERTAQKKSSRDTQESTGILDALKKELFYIEQRCLQIASERKMAKETVDKLSAKAKKYVILYDKLKKICIPDEKELYQEAKELALHYHSIFPEFYLEVQYHGLEDEAYVMPQLCKISEETGIPLIASNDVHMARQEGWNARQILRYNYFSKHQSVGPSEMELYIKDETAQYDALAQVLSPTCAKQAIRNTRVLSECHVELPHEKHYPVSGNIRSFYRIIETKKAEMKQSGEWTVEHEERLEKEISVMETMGVIDYHMIVYDYCRMIRILSCVPQKELPYLPKDFSKVEAWIKNRGFQSGVYAPPGRGSAAGSLVCYMLGITSLDPLKYQLLFDRYLNLDRITMPDIDTDVKRSLRPYIIKYLKWKYGGAAVASISTKTTYAGRSAVRMAGRDRADEIQDCEYTAKHVEPVISLIPEGASVSECDELLRNKLAADPEKILLVERAEQIEGRLQAVGVHAGGVVISDSADICDYVPVVKNEELNILVTQCDMVQVEEKGLLKMDILGLNTQDIISDTMQMVQKYRGINIDISKIEFEDEVFEKIFSAGYTNSVFQFESSGMKQQLKEFHPSSFEDLILIVAMYRPGPMQYIKGIIDVKHGYKKARYPIEELKPILSNTYGAIVYQEQVMQIFQKLAGYSLGQADLVRRAMSKKKEDKLKVERKAFLFGDPERGIEGCIPRGIDQKKAEQLFQEILEFAKYAFNKSHAAAYAMVAYQTAWLKYHYPQEFFCSVLNNTELDKYSSVWEDCRRMNITILPPDVNLSYYDFVLEDGNIRYGIRGIKGIASRAEIEAITNLRSQAYTETPFLSISNFMDRSGGGGGKKTMEALISAGAFDSFTPHREELFETYLRCRKSGSYSEMDHIKAGSKSCWALMHEIEALGTLVSFNGLEEYPDDKKLGCTPISELQKGRHSIFGLVISAKKKSNRSKKEPYMILSFAGRQGTVQILMSLDAYTQWEEYCNAGCALKVTGDYNDNLFFASSMRPVVLDKYYLCLNSIEATKAAEKIMNEREEGPYPLYVEFRYNASYERIPPTVTLLYLSKRTILRLGAVRFQDSGTRAKLDKHC